MEELARIKDLGRKIRMEWKKKKKPGRIYKDMLQRIW